MRTEMFIKSFRADADVAPHRIVKPGTTDGSATLSVLESNPHIGVADSLGATAGQVFDVVAGGYATVEYGATVVRGDPLTSDSTGRAVKATVAGSSLIGRAIVSGVVGDLGTVHVQLGTFAVHA